MQLRHTGRECRVFTAAPSRALFGSNIGYLAQRNFDLLADYRQQADSIRRLIRKRHATPPGLSCALTAASSPSRVNGLVRYWSEPAMRPRARSNTPSLLESMITGVFA